MYELIAALGFAALFGEAAFARNGDAGLTAAVVAFVATLLALALPPFLFKYTNENRAEQVMTQLMQRGLLGSGLILLGTIAIWFLVGQFEDAGFIGELYLFTAMGIFLYQGFGTVMTRHTMYLQQTHQYNSNQLAAVLLMVTLLIFTLVLYFLAFDLARPPALHPYLRDLIAISVTFLGYGRAIYLMAHH